MGGLGYDKNLCKLIKEIHNYGVLVKINDIYSLKIDSDNGEYSGVVYEIFKNGEIIGGFTDEECHYQLGEGYNQIYLYDNRDIIIVNDGDVSSRVVIKNLFEC